MTFSTAKSMHGEKAVSSNISHSLDIFHHNCSYPRRELLTACISRKEYSKRRARFLLTTLIFKASTPLSSEDTTSVATLYQETPPCTHSNAYWTTACACGTTIS